MKTALLIGLLWSAWLSAGAIHGTRSQAPQDSKQTGQICCARCQPPKENASPDCHYTWERLEVCKSNGGYAEGFDALCTASADPVCCGFGQGDHSTLSARNCYDRKGHVLNPVECGMSAPPTPVNSAPANNAPARDTIPAQDQSWHPKGLFN